ncbi:MAG: aminoacyl-tRNA hydrolase [Xanthomonadales bacterium]|nr:aminoacyl-tRNA hydrolase [Xanthomonadales bacterium]NIN59154.1 aminoacyl-tRNA hydrolase [Xanthomonadales bacterium]NIN74465.1 aminoacyl-tRNA hydrolase [Xanthomonadales bacterium]NIO13268.1 aminoacyl-tRNA hydrolase [Xanthomonadales bacterium]NIP11547.1 aminoacyl-tRNA hydrolase [Xanthomonadales bacterium]
MIIGLGNPGPKYAETRHNAGSWFLERLLAAAQVSLRERQKLGAATARTELHGHDCILARPLSYMNRCGRAVRSVQDYYRVASGALLIAYDELDLPPGVARLKRGGGHGGHNGLRDIFRHVADTGFLRLRIGIGHPGHRDAVTGYVLGRPPAQVRSAIDAAIDRAIAVLPEILQGRLEIAQQALHGGDA